MCWSRNSSDSACSVLVAGSHTTWLMPTTWRLRRAVAVAHADEEHGAAAHAGDVDRSREWDREPRLEVEAVQRVDDVDVGAVRRADCTVRLGQAHAEPGLVVVVEEREAVARERPRDRRGEVEQGLDRSGRGERREEEQEADGEDDEAAVQRTHERPPSVTA